MSIAYSLYEALDSTNRHTLCLNRSYVQFRAEENVILLCQLSKVHLTMRGLSGRLYIIEDSNKELRLVIVEAKSEWPESITQQAKASAAAGWALP
jgi:hypothetical protein